MIKSHNYKTHNFSLVELLVSLAIFMIMMGFLFTLFNGANKAWSRSDSSTRVYDRGRAILNLISTDLQNAVVSKEKGAEIPFWTGNTANGGSFLFAAVCNMEPETTPITTLCEVFYKFDQTDHKIKRSVTYDKLAAGTNNPNWNFLGTTSNYPSSINSWLHNDWNESQFQEIIDGVESCKIEFEFKPTTNPPPSANILPRIVRITITIYDPMVEATQRNKTKRTFSKLIYLPSAGQF